MEDLTLYLLALIIPLIASFRVHSTYKKYKKVNNALGKSGFEVAREMLDQHGLNEVAIVDTPGELTDHYDPKAKMVRLSTEIYNGRTVSSLAIAAHECGHAIQDKEGYSWMKLRSAIFPVVNIGTKIAYVVLFVSLILSMFELFIAAFVIVLLSLVFEIITLPVEFDASKRAKKYLMEKGIVNNDEAKGVKKVLNTAAWTYVAAVISSLLEMLRLLLIMNDRRD